MPRPTTARPAARPLSHARCPLAALAGAALVMLLLAQTGDAPAPGQGASTLFLPASGVALALTLCGGLALLPGLAAGWLLAYALAGFEPLHALVHALGHTAAVGIAAHWLRVRSSFEPDTPHFSVLRHLLLGACGVAALAGAALTSALHVLTDFPAPQGLLYHLLQDWMGQALGFLLVTPLMLAYRRTLQRPEPLTRLREGLIVWALAVLAAVVIFGGAGPSWLAPLANAYWMFLFVGWSGMRLGLAATMALLNLIALQALWGTYQGSGYFGRDIAATWGFGYWSYTMILGVMGLALASYMADRQRQKALQRAAELAQRNALVREVHHRIKNNLQGIVGMLRQLDRQHPALHPAINQMIVQVHSIAAVHGLQGRSLGETITLAELVAAIAQGVAQHWDTPITLTPAACPPWQVATSESVPVALVLGELMVNAVKHGGQAARDVRLEYGPASGPPGVRITLSNPGDWTQNSDAAAPLPAGHGLALVRLLLPRRGAQLSHQRQDGRVWAHLDLTPPVIHVENNPHEN